jgi:hypothetical protein
LGCHLFLAFNRSFALIYINGIFLLLSIIGKPQSQICSSEAMGLLFCKLCLEGKGGQNGRKILYSWLAGIVIYGRPLESKRFFDLRQGGFAIIYPAC